jgi:transcriptional enhancer factor
MASENLVSTQPSSLKKRVCTSISDAYTSSSSPLPNSRTHDVFQSIVKGRKSWKTLRGGEIVWPPELEAALLEGQLTLSNISCQYLSNYYVGLEAYQPDDSRETRLLGRFPMRNRFISDYIFHKTAKRRTAKQVGSRLQQLRDTCGGKRRTYSHSNAVMTVAYRTTYSLISSITQTTSRTGII